MVQCTMEDGHFTMAFPSDPKTEHDKAKSSSSERMYSQTSIFEHNPFEKAVRKVICSKCETIFLIKINANNFNPFQV